LRLFALMGWVLTDDSNEGLVQGIESTQAKRAGHQIVTHGSVRSVSREHLVAVAVLVLSAILYFVRLGDRALWASEFRWAEVAREMLLSHNYFWPTINGRVYFDKPLGSYWLVIGSTWISGHIDEAAARIPGATAGVLAVGLLILLARRLYDLRTGVAAGFILATSFSFAFWARTASADVETIAGELGALLIFVNHEERPGWWVVPMWLVMAMTSLMKGLLGFVLPALVIGAYSCFADGWRGIEQGLSSKPRSSLIHWLIRRNRWFFNWRTAVAAGLAGICYFAPFAISYSVTGSAKGIWMVYRENVERYFAPFDHRGPIYLYAYVIFGLMAPWSAFLPAAMGHAHNRPEAGDRSLRSDRFVLAFFWTIFIFFTLSGSRRSYYILPILPAASILVARIFVVANDDLGETAHFLLKIGFVVVVSILISLIVVFVPPHLLLPRPYSMLPRLPRLWIFATCWIVSLAAAGYACIRYSRKRVLLAVAVTSYALLIYLLIIAMPAGDRWRGEKRFAETTRQLIDGHPAELASFRTVPPVFYLGLPKPVPEYDTLPELEAAIRNGDIRWVIMRRRDIPVLKMPTHETASEASYPWDSAQHHANALVLMKLGH
jgi:4-amino-4-deoxy-L-arabinose transferase-like glycosyltransferase